MIYSAVDKNMYNTQTGGDTGCVEETVRERVLYDHHGDARRQQLEEKEVLWVRPRK